ncbi:hypothetical protein [Coxiella-like endosymbiont]|uniref:hypothetical protein n=1 Tax=Coxiella-like endosymbiont TaxID=1592897 RepID=UPI000CE5B67C|nr:hypothetical protein [Coxiella-like endosymbiont]
MGSLLAMLNLVFSKFEANLEDIMVEEYEGIIIISLCRISVRDRVHLVKFLEGYVKLNKCLKS